MTSYIICRKRLGIKKSDIELLKKSVEDRKLEYFKSELLKILDKKEKEESSEEVSKAFIVQELYKSMTDPLYMAKGGKVGAVGEIRTWNGKKYKKMPNKKWVRVYDTHDRHTEISIARLKGRVRKAQSVDELFEIVLNNTHRFSDENGMPLDIVLELKKEVDARKKTLNAGKPSKKTPDTGKEKNYYATRNGVTTEEERKKQLKAASEEDKELINRLKTSDERKDILRIYVSKVASGDMETKRDKLHALCKDNVLNDIMDSIGKGYEPVENKKRNNHSDYFFRIKNENGTFSDGGAIDKNIFEFAKFMWQNRGNKTVKNAINGGGNGGGGDGGDEPPKNDVKHDGEYVLTKDGSKDFGEITPEISKIIGRQAGKIRFTKGYQNPNDEGDGFGEEHFNRSKRIKQLNDAGYNNSRDFVEDVSKHFNKIYKGKGTSLILLKEGDKSSLEYVELTPSKDGDFWQVNSGHPVRADKFKNKTPLWSKPDNGIQTSEKERAQSSQFKESPSAISGSSDNSNIAQDYNDVNKKVKIDAKDFPEQFNKGKWKKQTKILMDFMNGTSGDSTVKSLYKKLGAMINNLPFKIAKPKQFSNGQFTVSCDRKTMKPLEQTLHLLDISDENENIRRDTCTKALHEIMHMIDFSCRDNKSSPDYLSNSDEEIVNAINNAKISDEEISELEEHFKDFRAQERKIIESLNEKASKIEELGRQYQSNEITTYEEYGKKYREIQSQWESERKKITELRAKNVEVSQYADILDALSGGNLHDDKGFGGHGKEYYRKESNKVNEIVANYAALLAIGSEYADRLKKKHPELAESVYNLYKKMLER